MTAGEEKDFIREEMEILRLFRSMTEIYKDQNGVIVLPRSATALEWQRLTDMMYKTHVRFMHFIVNEHKLTPQEQQVCILSRMKFSVNDTATIMNTSSNRVSNIRSAVSRKLFGLEGASQLNHKLNAI